MDETQIETFTRFSATVESMTSAFSFVMEYLDRAGPYPSVEINSCYSEENGTHEFQHYHVSVFSFINQLRET